MKNKIKLVLSIALMIASLFVIFKSFLGGICILLAGLVLFPKISDKLIENFPIWKNRAIRIATPILLFVIGASTNAIQNKDAIALDKREDVIINYIKQNVEQDKSLSNIKVLDDVGSLFNNGNYALSAPSSHLKSKTDNITQITTFTLNPVYDFETAIKSKYLKVDNKKGAIKDYQLIFEIDKDNNITSKKTIIKYTKTGNEEFVNESVPDITSLINNDLVALRKAIVKKQQEIDKLVGNDEFWNEFDPMVKERIYTLIKNKDCVGLQKEFNTTAKHAERFQKTKDTRAKKHSYLMTLIEDKKQEIGCYDK